METSEIHNLPFSHQQGSGLNQYRIQYVPFQPQTECIGSLCDSVPYPALFPAPLSFLTLPPLHTTPAPILLPSRGAHYKP